MYAHCVAMTNLSGALSSTQMLVNRISDRRVDSGGLENGSKHGNARAVAICKSSQKGQADLIKQPSARIAEQA